MDTTPNTSSTARTFSVFLDKGDRQDWLAHRDAEEGYHDEVLKGYLKDVSAAGHTPEDGKYIVLQHPPADPDAPSYQRGYWLGQAFVVASTFSVEQDW